MAESKRAAAPRSLSKSEIVTIRLDPKLRYMAEIAARKQRRSLSSFIEWAVEMSLLQVKLEMSEDYNQPDETVASAVATLWDVDEAERFVKLAVNYPELMTHDEAERWKMLLDSQLLAPARRRDSKSGRILWDTPMLEDFVFGELRRVWASLKDAHAQGPDAAARWVEAKRKAVADGLVYPMGAGGPIKPKPKSGFDDMDDDEIPF